jgi:hypothetical protein
VETAGKLSEPWLEGQTRDGSLGVELSRVDANQLQVLPTVVKLMNMKENVDVHDMGSHLRSGRLHNLPGRQSHAKGALAVGHQMVRCVTFASKWENSMAQLRSCD